MAIDNGFCRIDFHKFYASEIENILDGVFDKVESYKICNKVDSIKLQIIVGKGKVIINMFQACTQKIKNQ